MHFPFLFKTKVGMDHMRTTKTEMSWPSTIAFGTGLFGAGALLGYRNGFIKGNETSASILYSLRNLLKDDSIDREIR